MGQKSNDHISLGAVIAAAVILSAALTFILLVVNRSKVSFAPSGSVERVQELYKQGEPEKALEELSLGSDQQRGSAESLLWQGKLWYLTAFKRLNEERWESYAKKPEDWFEGEDVDNAIHALTRAAEAEVHFEEAMLYLGLIFMEKGWFKKSQRAFQKLLKKNSSHREGLLNYAILQSRTGKYQNAADVLAEGHRLYPADPEFAKNLFWIYRFHLKEPKLAVAYGDRFLKNADRSNPDLGRVTRELYDLLARFPEYDSDTLTLHSEPVREFIPRKRVSPFK